MKRTIGSIVLAILLLAAFSFLGKTASAVENRSVIFSAAREDGCLEAEAVAAQLRDAGIGESDVFAATCDSSVSAIGDGAFEQCIQLSGMVLPEGLEAIGRRAFYGTGQIRLTLPESVSAIGEDALGSKDEPLTLIVTEGSFAQQYAQENGLLWQTPRENFMGEDPAPAQETLIVGGTLALEKSSPLFALGIAGYGYFSTDPRVAEVSRSGEIEAKSEGSAVIGIERASGDVLVACEVLVQKAPVAVKTITLKNVPKTVLMGTKKTLAVQITPADATDKTLKWSTSDGKVLKVDQSGSMTAIGAGTAVITAAARDGSGVKAQKTVTVQAYVALKIGAKLAVQNDERTTVDNQGSAPFILSGKTMLPLRFIGEKLGGKVKYTSDSDPIVMLFGSCRVEFRLGAKQMKVYDGETTQNIQLEIAAQKKGGRTYIPLRAIAQALGFTVYYEAGEKIILVSSHSMTGQTRQARLNRYREAEKEAFEEFVNLAIAYAEKQPRYPVKNGRTIYGAFFGNGYAAWCTEFVMWSVYQAEKELGTSYIRDRYPWSSYSGGCVSWFRSRSRLHSRSSGYIPKRGDMIFFNYGTGGSTDHTGLVLGTVQSNGVTYVQTIEGNIPGDSPKQIRKRSIETTNKRIVCYGSVR